MSVTITLTGTILKKFPVDEKKTGFSKRKFWLQEFPVTKFSQIWELELHQQQIGLLDRFADNAMVKCSADVRGALWKEIVIVSLKCWDITAFSEEEQPQQQASPVGNIKQSENFNSNNNTAADEAPDDLFYAGL